MRCDDWEARLSAYLREWEGRPYAYGKADCALFSAGAVQVMTGVDPAAKFRGRYTTARGSVRALRKWGAGTLEATLGTMFPERPVGFARRGDLAFDGKAVGVVVGSDALFVGEAGLIRQPREAWTKAWAVE